MTDFIWTVQDEMVMVLVGWCCLARKYTCVVQSSPCPARFLPDYHLWGGPGDNQHHPHHHPGDAEYHCSWSTILESREHTPRHQWIYESHAIYHLKYQENHLKTDSLILSLAECQNIPPPFPSWLMLSMAHSWRQVFSMTPLILARYPPYRWQFCLAWLQVSKSLENKYSLPHTSTHWAASAPAALKQNNKTTIRVLIVQFVWIEILTRFVMIRVLSVLYSVEQCFWEFNCVLSEHSWEN